MAKPQYSQFFIPTYVRVFISDWNNLRDFIVSHGTPMKDKVNQTDINKDKIPSDLQLNNTMNGPYANFIASLLNHYSKIIKVRMELSLNDSDFFKREQHEQNPYNIPESVLKKISLAECDNILTQMNDLVGKLSEAWRNQATDWSNRTIDALIEHTGLHLSEIEEKEFLDDEPMSDILERFTELKIEPPKLKKGDMDFAQYLKLKCSISLHSVLHRSQQADKKTDINKLLKPLKGLLEEIHQQQQALLQAHESELMALTQPFNYS